MKALNLTTDDEIRSAYNDKTQHIYFREGSEGDYESASGHDLDTLLDATCHGFELVSVNGDQGATLKEEDIEFDGDKEVEM